MYAHLNIIGKMISFEYFEQHEIQLINIATQDWRGHTVTDYCTMNTVDKLIHKKQYIR